MRLTGCSAILILSIAAPSQAQTISQADITAVGTIGHPQNRPERTVDGNNSTFWQGSAALSVGAADFLAYRFSRVYRISQIAFVNDVQNLYALGQLDIQTSQDSTDGRDGVWTTIDSVAPDFNPPGGDFTRPLAIAGTLWIRLRLTYQGRGAYQGAFYLSEVIFSGEIAGSEPPAGALDALERFSTTVVVTASRTEQLALEAPVSTTVIGSRQIESSPARNPADLLRGVPGLNVVQISARDMSVTGRMATSAFAQGQLVLVDGRPIVNDPNGIAFWDMMPVRFDELEQVEVLHGPGSSVWGGDALTAVVNLRTKSPRAMSGGLFRVSLGEVGTRAVGARWAGAHDAVSYKFSGSYYRQGPWARPARLPDGSPMPVDFAYDNPPTAQPRFDVRVDWDKSDHRQWSFRSGYARTSGSLLTPTLPLEFSFLYSFYADASYTTPGMDAHIQYRRLVGQALSLLDGSPSNAVSDTPAGDVTFRRVIGTRQALIFGGSVRDDVFDIAATPNQRSRFQIGGFIDDQVVLSPKLRLNLGGRLDYIQTVGAAFSPRASLLVKPQATTSLRFAYSRAYRPPTLIENYLFIPFSFDVDLGQPFAVQSTARGNEELAVARSDGAEVGFARVFADRHTLAATVYHLVVKDEIQFGTSEFYGPADPPPGWPLPPAFVPVSALPKVSSFRNVGQLRSRGVELALDSNWSGHVWTRASYTYQANPTLTGADPQFPTTVNLPPAHQASALLGGSEARWRGSIGVTYVDRAFWSDALDARFWGYTNDYVLLNVSVALKFPAQKSEIVLDGTNLLDRKVQQHAFGDIIRRLVVVEYRLAF